MKKAISLPSWILPTLGLVLFLALFACVFRFTWNTAYPFPLADLALVGLIGVCGIFLLRIALIYHQHIQSEAAAPHASLLETLEESSIAGLAYDTHGTLVWVTQAMRNLFPQLTGSLCVGAPYFEIAQALDNMERTHRVTFPNTQAYFLCLRPHEKKLGPSLWVSVSENTVSPLTVVTFTDVSAYKDTELSLRTSERHLQHLYRLNHGLCADDESVIQALLIFGCQSLGFSVGYVVCTQESKADLFAIHGSTAHIDSLPFSSDRQARILQSADVVAIPNASDLAMRIVVDGHVWGYVGFLNAVSGPRSTKMTPYQLELVRLIALAMGRHQKHVQHEVTFRTTLEKERQASRLRLDSLAHMSHELRTPLNAIIGFSDAMVHEIFGSIEVPKYREYADSIKQAGHHLLGIINDTLDTARVQAGHLVLHEEHVFLPQLIQETHNFLHERAEKARVTLRTEVDASLRPLRGDMRRLRQVLLNLVSNALKFTPADGTVTVRAWCDANKTTWVQVSDTGVGMKEEDIATAMMPFGQVDNALMPQGEGTGLGLPLSRTLIEAHNGMFTLTSQLGRGTTATFSLPPERVQERMLIPDSEDLH